MNSSAGTASRAEPMAIIALGSNLGDSVGTIKAALQRLPSLSAKPILASSLWNTTPVDCPPGSPLFVNAVAAIHPHADETPESLLEKLQALEKEFGRLPKTVLNEARLLDLDIIAFGEERRDSPALTLPHPRAHLRQFVLQPLVEIAPDLILPSHIKTVAQLLNDLQTDEVLKRLD